MPVAVFVPRAANVGLLSACVVLLALASACTESSVASLQGRWDGEVRCATDTSDISISFEINEETIGGSTFTRTLGVNKEWAISGNQIGCTRYVRCLDDSCNAAAECQARHVAAIPKDNPFGAAGCPDWVEAGIGQATTCTSFGRCEPCLERQSYSRLILKLADEAENVPDPVLDVAREGLTRLEGTITGFCPDEHLQTPQVVLDKEQR